MRPVILLRGLFLVVLGGMLAAIGWASGRGSLFATPAEVRLHPWFLTTLLDAYLAFLIVYLWVAWKECSRGARVLWFVAIMLWGNVAIAVYLLVELARCSSDAPLQRLMTERRPGRLAWPATLSALALVVYGASALTLWS